MSSCHHPSLLGLSRVQFSRSVTHDSQLAKSDKEPSKQLLRLMLLLRGTRYLESRDQV